MREYPRTTIFINHQNQKEMKRLKRFVREARSNSMLGFKRRKQLAAALFAIPLLLFMFAMPFVAGGSGTRYATLCTVPIAGFSLISKAKKEDELTEEEKETLGTIQAALAEGIEKYRKGTISAEELNEALEKMKKEISEEEERKAKRRKEQEDAEREERKKKRKKESEELEEENQKRDKRIKEAIDLIEEVRKVVSELAGEVEEEKKKRKSAGFNLGRDTEFGKSMREAFASEKFKSFANNNTSTKSGEFELKQFNKGLIRKGPVSFDNNYTGNVLPAYQSDVTVTEVNLQRLNLRDFMTVIDASEEEFTSYAFARIYDIDRAAAAVSENGELPEGSFKVKEVVCETHRIGWHLPVSKRMLKKLRILENRIMTMLPSGMSRQENFQIIYGDANDPNFVGIEQLCPNEAALNSVIYDEQVPGKVRSIESYAGGAKTKVNFTKGFAKIETGMKITFAGFGTALDAGWIANVYNDESVVVDCAYAAVPAATVLAQAKFKVENVWGQFVTDPNMGDAMQTVASHLSFLQYMPNLIVLNPIDYCALTTMKDNIGRKLFGDYVKVENGVPLFGGIIPIAQLDCIKKGHCLIGDFKNGCELIDTQRGFMEFAEDVKTKLTNQVESIISEEVIFAVTVPDAFMYFDIKNVINIIHV